MTYRTIAYFYDERIAKLLGPAAAGAYRSPAPAVRVLKPNLSSPTTPPAIRRRCSPEGTVAALTLKPEEAKARSLRETKSPGSAGEAKLKAVLIRRTANLKWNVQPPNAH